MFEYLVFKEEETFAFHSEIRIEVDGDELKYRMDGNRYGMPEPDKRCGTYRWDADSFIRKLESFDVPSWKDEYFQPYVDGYSWELRYKEVGKRCKKIAGFNDEPDCFKAFVNLLFSVSGYVKMLDYLRYTESEKGVEMNTFSNYWLTEAEIQALREQSKRDLEYCREHSMLGLKIHSGMESKKRKNDNDEQLCKSGRKDSCPQRESGVSGIRETVQGYKSL